MLVDVHEDGWTREPEAHRWNEALPTRQHPGFGPVLLQVCKRLVCRVGPKVIEGCRNHVVNLLPRQCRACRTTRRRKGDPEKNRLYTAGNAFLRTVP